jgi:hypothetical protein
MLAETRSFFLGIGSIEGKRLGFPRSEKNSGRRMRLIRGGRWCRACCRPTASQKVSHLLRGECADRPGAARAGIRNSGTGSPLGPSVRHRKDHVGQISSNVTRVHHQDVLECGVFATHWRRAPPSALVLFAYFALLAVHNPGFAHESTKPRKVQRPEMRTTHKMARRRSSRNRRAARPRRSLAGAKHAKCGWDGKRPDRRRRAALDRRVHTGYNDLQAR